MNIRKEFEEKFPVPDGVYWYAWEENDGHYVGETPEYIPDADFYEEKWQVWKAAHEEYGQWKQAVDEGLVVAHLGTADSYESAKYALNDLCNWHKDLGEYFALHS